MVNITVDSKAAQQLMMGIAKRAAQPQKAMEKVSEMMLFDVHRHFTVSEGLEGQQWAGLKQSTWEWKTKHGYYSMLRNTGNLWKNNIQSWGNDFAKISNIARNKKGDYYGYYHQYGTKNMPARPFMWLSTPALNRISLYMANFLIKQGVVSV